MTSFLPIAVIGRGCVLPGALTPDELWKLVSRGDHAISDVPDHYWGVDPKRVLTDANAPEIDRTWTTRGGFVSGFEDVFDPSGFHVPKEELTGLDLIFHWGLHAARQALLDAGIGISDTRERAGVILGNKSYPTRSLADFAEQVWRGERMERGQPARNAVDPRNRFMSGLPAQLIARSVGFGGPSYCLDVACASSLYAIKLACDRLHRGDADVMLAGGINRADDLFLRVGFCALNAMSRSGQSRPFHRDADGLVPAEGAAFVALKRLDDAVKSGDPILGVIRGIGLSNDGRSRGLLTPSEEGQVRCMKAAYNGSGLDPRELSLVECHAAGTALGDATEVRSVSQIIGDVDEPIPIASLKSNLGHLITVSGVAGLLKVLSAMEHQLRPATLHADDPIDELDGSGPLRHLTEAEPWECDGPRQAAINNFGFGGNNAHIVVEEYLPEKTTIPVDVAIGSYPDEPIAVVDLSIAAADASNRNEFARALFYGDSRVTEGEDGPEARAKDVSIDIGEVRFPPLDLKKALPQQLAVLEATLRMADTIATLPRESTGISLGMQCDAEICRYLVRWRLGHQLGDADQVSEALIGALDAAGVLGTMPNLVTNRLNSQFDLAGPSLTLSAEEVSGLLALELASEALRNGELDAAVVGAVDFSCEPVQRNAAEAFLPDEKHIPGDAACAMVLKRLSDAQADGDEILAVFPASTVVEGDADQITWEVPDLTPLFGHSHTASSLVRVAAAIDAATRRARPATDDQPPMPWLPDHGRRSATITDETVLGDRLSITVESHRQTTPERFVDTAPPTLDVYAADSMDALISTVENRKSKGEGRLRLTIAARGAEQRDQRHAQAVAALSELDSPDVFTRLGAGTYFGTGSLDGDTAFVFTGPAGSYQGMGRELVLAIPELADAFARRCQCVDRAAGWIYEPPTDEIPGPGKKLWGASFLCQVHAELTRNVLGIEPEAAIGFCAGETNALFAMGAWNDFDGLYEDLEREGIFTRRLGGKFTTVEDAFDLQPGEGEWQTWRVLAPLETVEDAVDGEERCYITIVNAPGDLVVGGAPDACARVIERIGKRRARPLGYNIAMHCAAASPLEQLWYDLHHRPTEPVEGVRFYTHATLDHYEVDAEKIAHALVGQAMGRVDFPRLINKAYDDGVRVFIEHGPRSGCTRWIGKILGDRPHLAVSLDRTGKSSLDRAVDTTARLVAAGVDVDHRALTERLSQATPLEVAVESEANKGPTLTFPAHPKPVRLLGESSKETPNFSDLRSPISDFKSTSTSLATNTDRVATSQKPVGIALPLPPLLPATTAQIPAHAVKRAPAVSNGETTPENPTTTTTTTATTSRSRSEIGDRRSEIREVGAASAPQTPAAQLAKTHADFLRRRADIHRQFLEQQHRQAQWFLQMATGQRSAAISDRPPTPPNTQYPSPNTGRPALFTRDDLLTHASGEISQIFGPDFARQDPYPRQTRMPEPPLLLVDRVTGIDAEQGAMESKGVIWTETDVRPDAWYLHRGRMPVGLTVEAGQADLMLISWMGADFENRGERVYRLLGCELTFHGELPKPGETLEFEIHIDEHARQGAVRIFFFHYDCYVDGELRLSMRNGQAGFFSDEELANSDGVLWKPEDIEPPTAPPAEPVVAPNRTRFGPEALRAFAEGRGLECFGDGFERLASHTETPAIAGGDMLFLDEVEVLKPTGGPHGRGYLRAVQKITPDTWFFDGHFKNDPCMPGTLMLQGCTQAMAFYLAALGFTIDRDGWRFEPVSGASCEMRCRGQVTPKSKEVVYELFVREIDAGPKPKLYADMLCIVDGLKAFHCERLAIGLAPDWPLTHHPEWIDEEIARSHGDDRPVLEADGHRFDEAAMMATCLGRPSDAFGPMYRPFDGALRAPRLPNPPYLFISRINDVTAPPNAMEQGTTVVAEYDVPRDAWYFKESNTGAMPFGALMEVGLQPCGWLASYTGCALTTDRELFFRNLDGTGEVFREVTPETKRLRTEATLKTISRSGGMIIVGFDVEVATGGGERVFAMDTVFGFFPKEALANQAGLTTNDEQRARLSDEAPQTPDLTVPGVSESLTMFDRVMGSAGSLPVEEPSNSRIRSEQDVDPSAWYFNAHFFQDPVQPGSLGVEGMLQLLQTWMVAEGMHREIADPRFVPIATERKTSWKYRGQVVPENEQVTLDMEITERSEPGAERPYAVATVSLWVDGTRIYEVTDLAMEIVSDPTSNFVLDTAVECSWAFDPATDSWLLDHCPTFTRPALPMTSIADLLARAAADATGEPVVELRDVHLRGWAVIDGATKLTTRTETDADGWCTIELHAPDKPLATARVRCSTDWPQAPDSPADLETTEALEDPYKEGKVFHGPAFQLFKCGEEGTAGSRGVLDASKTGVPVGEIHPALLDAALHIIPHDGLRRWSDDVPEDTVAYPHKIEFLTFHGPIPTGDVDVEVRLTDVADERFVTFHIQFLDDGRVWADLELVEVLFPMGRIAQGKPAERRAFLRDKKYAEGLGVSRFDGETTRLSVREFRNNDWFEGTIASVYEVDGDLVEMTRQVAIKDHLARQLEVHPSTIVVDGVRATCASRPGEEFEVEVDNEGPMEFVVR